MWCVRARVRACVRACVCDVHEQVAEVDEGPAMGRVEVEGAPVAQLRLSTVAHHRAQVVVVAGLGGVQAAGVEGNGQKEESELVSSWL